MTVKITKEEMDILEYFQEMMHEESKRRNYLQEDFIKHHMNKFFIKLFNGKCVFYFYIYGSYCIIKLQIPTTDKRAKHKWKTTTVWVEYIDTIQEILDFY